MLVEGPAVGNVKVLLDAMTTMLQRLGLYRPLWVPIYKVQTA